MSSRRIAYQPRPDTTPAAELSALVNVYRCVLEASRKKEAAGRLPSPNDPDGTTVQGDSADAPSIQK